MDQLMQRSVMRTFLLPSGKHFLADRAKQRPALGIDHGHDNLCTARRVKHNPVESRTDASYRHELAYGNHVHPPSLPQPRPNGSARGAESAE